MGVVATPEAQAELGDSWWKLAEEEQGTEQRQLKQRAAHWYRQAVNGLKRLSKTRVESRIKTLADQDTDAATAAPATISDQNLRQMLVANEWWWDYYSDRKRRRNSMPLIFTADGLRLEGVKRYKRGNWRINNTILETLDGRYRFNADLRRWERLDNSPDNPSSHFFIILVGQR
jgi:hypothetical protein